MVTKKISQLPAFVGTTVPDGDIPISILGTTYKISPSQLPSSGGSGSQDIDDVLGVGSIAIDKSMLQKTADDNYTNYTDPTILEIEDVPGVQKTTIVGGVVQVSKTDTTERTSVVPRGIIYKGTDSSTTDIVFETPTAPGGQAIVKDTAGATETIAFETDIPTDLSHLGDDATHRLVTDAQIAAWNAKQSALGFTPEDSANKSTSTADSASSVKFPVWSAILSYFSTSRIKTLLGQASSSVDGWVSSTDWNTFNGKVTKTAATTGSVIAFVTPQVYNTNGSPSSSNITDDLTNSVIGVVQKIYSNKSVEPTYPAGWVKVGPGAYVPSTLNIIFAEWVSGTRVEYWIVQPAS